MKLCPKALKMRADYLTDQKAMSVRVETYEAHGRESLAASCRGMLGASKTQMARALNRHVSQCKECG